jgi:hypothetical protein
MPTETQSTHYQNAEPRIKATITGVGNTTPTDPPGINVDIIAPDGTRTTYVYGTDVELVKDAVGVYYVEPILSQLGQYRIFYQTTGANTVSALHHATVCDYPALGS